MGRVTEQDNQAEILSFIEMAQKGDKAMKLAVVNLFKPMAYSMVYRSFYHKEERVEMCQEACLQILEAIEDFDVVNYRHVYFRHYLKNRLRFMILNRIWRIGLERKRFACSLDEKVAGEDGEEDCWKIDWFPAACNTEDQAIRGCMAQKVLAVMRKQMVQETYEDVCRHFMEGISYAEIALERGQNRSTVQYQCSRAMDRVKRELLGEEAYLKQL
ncbi:sigma-70 family RNA polymerase sigma factor [Eubacterium sp. 1001713B170207_170306_E7]|uniref:RNA polymerase sigma factor n=1 Tax=Eubacterium sp. 1001713B170207_170306_E7 TaxID=2787097 RepID=UPI001898D6DA|nr:sigma-70 family RNA polymerase sigma factor [Eubacterium sp. 1001713B170207_170306_E7]